METIVACIHSEDTCCIFEKCPMLKNCFPNYYEEYVMEKKESPVCKICEVSDCDNRSPEVKHCPKFREKKEKDEQRAV